ncbi:LPXTG cell wall anchor domain-containing protein [Enterococcus sp. LJL128]
MKKMGLICALLLGFSFGVNTYAETGSYEQVESADTSETTPTTDLGVPLETEASSTDSSIEPDEFKQTELLENEPLLPISEEENSVTILTLTGGPAARYQQGATINPADFKQSLDQTSGLSLENLAFESGNQYTTAILGINPANITATDSEGKSYLINCTYIVESNVATLVLEIVYDSSSHSFNGTTSPGASVYFYILGLPSDPIIVAADNNGHFSINAKQFDAGSTVTATAYTIAGVEYSETITFKIPILENTTQPSTISSTTSAIKPDPEVPSVKEKLPETGESASNTLLKSGILSTIGAFSLLVLRKKNRKA